ncbi:LPS assembly lipoprotein LptE [uncultured Methylibium sp.]|uniref:LPS-assembly lipoprotein LptE n=1 Tax=uncultured Methylibium sp. TaxID=381093 RepID=UPI0025D8DFBD|nr:LPS assembly lipoprotein LptE [uncultured Methylibium sp.]
MPLHRRRALQLAAAAWVAQLAACGFQLRRPPTLAFASVQLVGFPQRSPFTEQLKRAIEASGSTRVVESPAQAQVVLEALEDVRDKSVAAQTAAGQVREFTLRTRLRFRLRTPAGRVLIRDTELLLSRDMSYNESNALAKEQEEAMLYRGMQSDIVDQVMRQLAAVPPL